MQGPDALALQMRSEVEQALLSVLLLDRYPKATVDVHCMVLERGGSEGAALLMAGSLAAIDAGIECRCVLSAVNLVRHRRYIPLHHCGLQQQGHSRARCQSYATCACMLLPGVHTTP